MKVVILFHCALAFILIVVVIGAVIFYKLKRK